MIRHSTIQQMPPCSPPSFENIFSTEIFAVVFAGEEKYFLGTGRSRRISSTLHFFSRSNHETNPVWNLERTLAEPSPQDNDPSRNRALRTTTPRGTEPSGQRTLRTTEPSGQRALRTTEPSGQRPLAERTLPKRTDDIPVLLSPSTTVLLSPIPTKLLPQHLLLPMSFSRSSSAFSSSPRFCRSFFSNWLFREASFSSSCSSSFSCFSASCLGDFQKDFTLCYLSESV